MLLLNDKQKGAVQSNEQFLFLLAGAGTGKTRTIVEKINHLINNNIALKSEILCITFTKKASVEMK
ncbi:UvrD-helicase domain-containing protein, partial [Acholeplasma sp. OttesenSCG-928-E16]|nr:UvrD-helicase domain-containing protein [Acholeplasma sp. OttesenSCG-928-E16]